MIANIDPSAAKSAVGPIYQLKVVLLGAEPPIWRRLQVPGNANLGWLHAVLQTAMGWTNSHLHHFLTQDARYSDPRHHEDMGLGDEPDRDEAKSTGVTSKEFSTVPRPISTKPAPTLTCTIPVAEPISNRGFCVSIPTAETTAVIIDDLSTLALACARSAFRPVNVVNLSLSAGIRQLFSASTSSNGFLRSSQSAAPAICFLLQPCNRSAPTKTRRSASVNNATTRQRDNA